MIMYRFQTTPSRMRPEKCSRFLIKMCNYETRNIMLRLKLYCLFECQKCNLGPQDIIWALRYPLASTLNGKEGPTPVPWICHLLTEFTKKLKIIFLMAENSRAECQGICDVSSCLFSLCRKTFVSNNHQIKRMLCHPLNMLIKQSLICWYLKLSNPSTWVHMWCCHQHIVMHLVFDI